MIIFKNKPVKRGDISYISPISPLNIPPNGIYLPVGLIYSLVCFIVVGVAVIAVPNRLERLISLLYFNFNAQQPRINIFQIIALKNELYD